MALTQTQPKSEPHSGRIRSVLGTLCLAFLLGPSQACVSSHKTPGTWPDPGSAWARVAPSNWRGITLAYSQLGTIEKISQTLDFKSGGALGLNYLRLEVPESLLGQYRLRLDPDEALQKLDSVLDLAQAAGWHVTLVLTTRDRQTLRASLDHYRHAALALAFRFQQTPAELLSFEFAPWGDAEDATAASKFYLELAQAVWELDPKRYLLFPAARAGAPPIHSFYDPRLIWSVSGYYPNTFAPTAQLPAEIQYPTWPVPRIAPTLFGPEHPGRRNTLIIQSEKIPIRAATIRIHRVFLKATLQARAGRQPVFTRKLIADSGSGLHNRAYSFQVPPKCHLLELAITDGDRVSFSSLHLTLENGESVELAPSDPHFDTRSTVITIDRRGQIDPGKTPMFDSAWLTDQQIQPWLAAGNRVPVVITSLGASAWISVSVRDAWLQDQLTIYRRHGFGWSLNSADLAAKIGFTNPKN